MQDAHDHAQRGGLAGAVWTDEAVHASGRHLEGQIIDGHMVAERFGNLVNLDGCHSVERSLTRMFSIPNAPKARIVILSFATASLTFAQRERFISARSLAFATIPPAF